MTVNDIDRRPGRDLDEGRRRASDPIRTHPSASTGMSRSRPWAAPWHTFVAWLAIDDDYVRPMPTAAQRRHDVVLAVVLGLLMLVSLESVRSLGLFTDIEHAAWQVYLVALVGVVPLAWRRRFPLVVTVLSQAHFFVLGIYAPQVLTQPIVQGLCLFGLLSGVAWGRDRRATLLVALGDIVFMFGWVALDFALGNAMSNMRGDAPGAQGLLPPILAMVVYSALMNVAFFFGACWWGQSMWLSARDNARLARQSRTIREQSVDLQEQAVVEERLRIARELHDVVAHHVSVIGVQAGAARRALTKRPEAAAQALLHVEESSRTAVTEMRSLLGTLRTGATSQEQSTREPGPGIGALRELVQGFASPGLQVHYDLVQDGPDAVESVPAPISLSLYRIVQESLSNVRAHSSARTARVVVRVRRDQGLVEAEVVDDGRPIGATGGSGVGLIGMRERVAAQQGRIDIGPRLQGGFRVRVRFPL